VEQLLDYCPESKPEETGNHPVLGDPPRRGYTKLFSGSFGELLHPPPQQIPFLDGLRTIAILLVVNLHFSAGFAELHGNNFYSTLPFVINGWCGVDLFFVLSGFFIGGQLWKELQKDGTISIRRFILRRGLRIWPLFYFMYFASLLLYWHDAATKQYGWTDLVFLANYLNNGIVGGGWSLCTEEQFYIVAPLLLLFLFARKKTVRSIRPWLWGLLALIPTVRGAIWIYHTGNFFSHDPALFATMYYKFHTHCDGLIVGLIVSNLWLTKNKPKSPVWKASLVLLGGFALLILSREIQHEVLVLTGFGLFFGSLVWFGLTSRVELFRSRPFYWISRLSFGMYLNHGYLVHPVLSHLLPRFKLFHSSWIPNQLLGTLILTGLSAAVALVTFCLVEHPFLKLRAQLLERRREHVPVYAHAES
jgi:peptidoglycan/LPS O-acetylase OafA/YrhL